jgi:hypothetical protein
VSSQETYLSSDAPTSDASASDAVRVGLGLGTVIRKNTNIAAGFRVGRGAGERSST